MGAAAPCPREVSVWLFGELARHAPMRPLRLEVAAATTPRLLLDEVVARCGPALAERVLSADGTLQGCCRLCLDGELFDDLDTPVNVPPGGSEMELILLWATEGG